MKLFVFMYLFTEDLEKIRKTLGSHVKYWRNLELSHYQNGPFTDKSGGLIIFSADGLDRARDIIASDPLLPAGALRQYWLKEWIP